MPCVRDLSVGDVAAIGGVVGTLERIVHYGGAFDVRLAVRDHNGKLHWRGANYPDRIRAILSVRKQ